MAQTSVEHPNVQRARDAYAAFGTGDLDTVKKSFHPDIVWHVGGHNQLTGDYKGIDQVLGFFGKLFELTAGSFKLEVHDIIANDTHTVVLLSAHAEKDGKVLDGRSANITHTDGEGLVTEFWQFNEKPEEGDAFFGN